MHSVFVSHYPTIHFHISKIKGILILILLAGGISAMAQSETYSFAPADSQFVMELARGKNEVTIAITFRDSIDFEYVAVERKADFSQEFSQCSYLGFDEVKAKGRKVVKRDIYPFPASSDVQYRLKFSTTDGATRTYPSVTLPATKK